MRIFISVDMEGISGVEKVEEIFRGMPAYHTFRQIMAGDVNAAVQGAFEGGATDVVVADSHGYMCNLRPKDLHRRVTLKSGMKRTLCQFKGFSVRFDAAFFIGYHSKAGTENGILSHTWIPAFQDVRVNGLSVGEYGLNGFLVSSFGVPIILLTGDDKTVEQARPLLGDIEYVVVKKSLGYFEGDHLPLAESHARIREGARRAVQKAAQQKTPILKVSLPVTFELDLCGEKNSLVTEMTQENLRFVDDDVSQPLSDVDLVAQYEKVGYCGPETVTFTCNRYLDAYNTLFTIMMNFYERDIEWLLEEVAKPEEYRRDLRQLIAGSPLNYLA
jgi:D-amino peptidase